MNSTATTTKPALPARTPQADPNFNEICLRMQGNIQDALALSRKLEAVLGAAHRKMLERDIPALEVSLESQVKLLNMLQINASLREHYLKQVGLSSDSQGINEFFNLIRQVIPERPGASTAALISPAALEKYWFQLEGAASRCQQLNNANGRLLARLSASTRKIIELAFTGQPAATYDKRGLSVSPVGE
ncbi:MAG: flagellar export chaperone FlgN [Endozoicomonas sp.]